MKNDDTLTLKDAFILTLKLLCLVYLGFELQRLLELTFSFKSNSVLIEIVKFLSYIVAFSAIIYSVAGSKVKQITTDIQQTRFITPVMLVLLLLTIVSYVVIIAYFLGQLHIPHFYKSKFLATSDIANFVLAVLVAPFLEEILYRRIVLGSLLEKYDAWQAILLSSLLFGIAHAEPIRMLNAMMMGLLLGWVYNKTRSLLPCIIIHMVANLLAFISVVYYAQITAYWRAHIWYDKPFYIILLLIAVSLFGVSLALMNDSIEKIKERHAIDMDIQKDSVNKE